jgi:hypothetical protein
VNIESGGLGKSIKHFGLGSVGRAVTYLIAV